MYDKSKFNSTPWLSDEANVYVLCLHNIQLVEDVTVSHNGSSDAERLYTTLRPNGSAAAKKGGLRSAGKAVYPSIGNLHRPQGGDEANLGRLREMPWWRMKARKTPVGLICPEHATWRTSPGSVIHFVGSCVAFSITHDILVGRGRGWV
jgi:hypothetical protein